MALLRDILGTPYLALRGLFLTWEKAGCVPKITRTVIVQMVLNRGIRANIALLQTLGDGWLILRPSVRPLLCTAFCAVGHSSHHYLEALRAYPIP